MGSEPAAGLIEDMANEQTPVEHVAAAEALLVTAEQQYAVGALANAVAHAQIAAAHAAVATAQLSIYIQAKP